MTKAINGEGVELTHRQNSKTSDESEAPFLEHDGHSVEEVATQQRPIRSNSYRTYASAESHQFEPNESEVWWHHQLQR